MRAAVLLALASASCGSATPSSEQGAPPSDHEARVDAALAWLPEGTETVLVANGPFRLQRPPRFDPGDPEAFYHQERIAFVELVRAQLFNLAYGVTWGTGPSPFDALYDLDFDFALEGSHRFRPPRGLGRMTYQGCLVVAAMPASHDAMQALFAGIAQRADERIVLASVPVAVAHAPECFVASPRAGLLCIANDRGELETLLGRMAGAPSRVAFPPDLPEWKQIDRKAAFFALRHYRRDDVADDPSSPLRGEAAANVPDPGAIGLVVVVREEVGPLAIARYLSDGADPLRIARRAWTPSEGPPPSFALLAPGVVEVSQDVVHPLPASRFLFHALALLGHGVYV